MRELWPSPGAEADPAAAYAADPRPAPEGRPWVLANMISSADGAATLATGTSGGLGGPADREVFAAIRAVADVIVVGAGTVAAEDYGPARLSPALREARAARGQAPVPRIAVVSASLRLDPGLRLFADAAPDARPLVVTAADADERRRRRLAEVADVVEVGDEQVEWPEALAALASDTAARVVLCEGGPRTNAQLIAADLLDELCVTLAPILVDGEAPRIAQGPGTSHLRRLALSRVLEADGYLFLRYARRDGTPVTAPVAAGPSKPNGPRRNPPAGPATTPRS
jgi:riboflavin-specific deaminase-like protein